MTSDARSPSYGLAIHTTSPDLGLAICSLAKDSREETPPPRVGVWNLGRETSSQLHTHLLEILQPQTWSDLAFLAVAKGPGGFTGTRIGVVAARTLAQQLEIPLFAVSSLAAIAHAAATEESGDIAVQMRAQRQEVFGAIYSIHAGRLEERLPDRVMSLEEWQRSLAQWQQPYRLVEAEGNLGDSVTSVLALARAEWQRGQRPHWSEALPYYGQHPVVHS